MSEVKVDTISERTSANGVVVDGVTIKDSGLTIPSGGTLTIDSGGTITNNGSASGLGGLIPISETVTSSDAATLDITLPSSTTYNGYVIKFESMNPSVSSGYFRAYFSEDGGSNWISSSSYFNVYISGSATTYCALHREDISVQDNTTTPLTFDLELHNINNEGAASMWWRTRGTFVSYQNGLMYDVAMMGRYNSTNAINAIRIFNGTGNIDAGARYKIYGVVDV